MSQLEEKERPPAPNCTEPVKTDIDKKPPVVVIFLRQGAFCMARPYTHVQAVEKEMLEIKAEGKTNCEIAEYFGFQDKSAFFYAWGFYSLSVPSGAL